MSAAVAATEPSSPGRPPLSALAGSARSEALAALDRIGKEISLGRDEGLFLEGDAAQYCFKVVAGAVRSCRLLGDGRRHVAEFFLRGDFIGLAAESANGRSSSCAGIFRRHSSRCCFSAARTPSSASPRFCC
jgi:CRP/FNR family nitrogen fixation transcriptional regulator